MPRKTINQKIDTLQEQIKKLQDEKKRLEEKKFKDVGKYLFDKWNVESDEQAMSYIDEFAKMVTPSDSDLNDGGSIEKTEVATK